METTVINATEYRELPLALLNESKTNPRRVFDEVSLRELAASIRSQGVLVALACPATHRKRLRDRGRCAALSRRADGRSRHRAGAHQADERRRSIGGAACREPDSRRNSPDGRGRRLRAAFGAGGAEVQHRAAWRACWKISRRSSLRASSWLTLCPLPSMPSTPTKSAWAMRCYWRSCPPTSSNRHSRLASRKSTTGARAQRGFSCRCETCNSGLRRMFCSS